MRKIISFMHISFGGFVSEPNGEMKRIKADDEIIDHVGKWISEDEIITNFIGSYLFHAKTPGNRAAKFFLAS